MSHMKADDTQQTVQEASIVSDKPQRSPQQNSNKKHQLTAPNTFPRKVIQDHIEEAIESVVGGSRIAVFEPTHHSNRDTIVVQPSPSADGKKLRLSKVSEHTPAPDEQTDTLKQDGAIRILTERLSTTQTELGGEFFTAPVATGCEVTVIKTI
jgi:hypothetical protein